ncbi:MAG: hypothetical protein ACRDRL_27635 [Sciscionella sp.]
MPALTSDPTEITELRAELEHARRARDAWHSDVRDHDLRIASLESDLQYLKKLGFECAAERDRLAEELGTVRSDLDAAHERVRELGIVRNDLATQRDRLAEELGTADKECDRYRRDYDRLCGADVRAADVYRRERDQWVARTVEAQDAVSRVRGQIAELLAELDEQFPAETSTDTAEADTRGAAAPARSMVIDLRCAVCDRTRATHQLIKGHSFTPKETSHA